MANRYMVHFHLVFFCPENQYLFIFIYFHFCLYVFIFITIKRFTIKLYLHETSNSFPYFLCSFDSLLSIIVKDIVLLPLKCLTYPTICGNFIYNSLMTSSSSLYPMKYLNEFFYHMILFQKLIFYHHHFICLRQFFVFIDIPLVDLFISKIYVLSDHS